MPPLSGADTVENVLLCAGCGGGGAFLSASGCGGGCGGCIAGASATARVARNGAGIYQRHSGRIHARRIGWARVTASACTWIGTKGAVVGLGDSITDPLCTRGTCALVQFHFDSALEQLTRIFRPHACDVPSLGAKSVAVYRRKSRVNCHPYLAVVQHAELRSLAVNSNRNFITMRVSGALYL